MEFSGSLFKNNYKNADNHPDYKGNGKVGEEEHDIAAWVRKDKNGNSFFSVKISPKRLVDAPKPAAPAAPAKQVSQETVTGSYTSTVAARTVPKSRSGNLRRGRSRQA